MQVNSVSHSFINQFLSTHNILNEPNDLNIELPENKLDNYFDSVTEDDENQIKTTSKPLRKSVVAFTVDDGLSEGNFPNGSGVLLTPRIIATNSHVVEGKEKPIITLYNGLEVTGSVLDHHNEMDVSLILLDSPITSIDPVKIANSRPNLGD